MERWREGIDGHDRSVQQKLSAIYLVGGRSFDLVLLLFFGIILV